MQTPQSACGTQRCLFTDTYLNGTKKEETDNSADTQSSCVKARMNKSVRVDCGTSKKAWIHGEIKPVTGTLTWFY